MRRAAPVAIPKPSAATLAAARLDNQQHACHQVVPRRRPAAPVAAAHNAGCDPCGLGCLLPTYTISSPYTQTELVADEDDEGLNIAAAASAVPTPAAAGADAADIDIASLRPAAHVVRPRHVTWVFNFAEGSHGNKRERKTLIRALHSQLGRAIPIAASIAAAPAGGARWLRPRRGRR